MEVDICPQAKMLCTEDLTILVHEAFRASAVTEENKATGELASESVSTPASALHAEAPFTKATGKATMKSFSRERVSNQSNQSGMQHRVGPPGSCIPQQPQALRCSAQKPLHCLEYLIPRTQERERVLTSLATAPAWTKAGPVQLMCLQKGRGHRSLQ